MLDAASDQILEPLGVVDYDRDVIHIRELLLPEVECCSRLLEGGEHADATKFNGFAHFFLPAIAPSPRPATRLATFTGPRFLTAFAGSTASPRVNFAATLSRPFGPLTNTVPRAKPGT